MKGAEEILARASGSSMQVKEDPLWRFGLVEANSANRGASSAPVPCGCSEEPTPSPFLKGRGAGEETRLGEAGHQRAGHQETWALTGPAIHFFASNSYPFFFACSRTAFRNASPSDSGFDASTCFLRSSAMKAWRFASSSPIFF